MTQTLNGVLTETYQDLVVRGDLQVDSAVTFTNQQELTHDGEVLTYEGESLTYEDED